MDGGLDLSWTRAAARHERALLSEPSTPAPASDVAGRPTLRRRDSAPQPSAPRVTRSMSSSTPAVAAAQPDTASPAASCSGSSSTDVAMALTQARPVEDPSSRESSPLTDLSTLSPRSEWADTPASDVFPAQRSTEVPRIAIEAPVAARGLPPAVMIPAIFYPTPPAIAAAAALSRGSSSSGKSAGKGKAKAKAPVSLPSTSRKRRKVAFEDGAWGDGQAAIGGADAAAAEVADIFSAPSAAHDELYVARTLSVSPLPQRASFVRRDGSRRTNEARAYDFSFRSSADIVQASRSAYVHCASRFVRPG